jgi:hypothetical protein
MSCEYETGTRENKRKSSQERKMKMLKKRTKLEILKRQKEQG